jgi:hypothetical protein
MILSRRSDTAYTKLAPMGLWRFVDTYSCPLIPGHDGDAATASPGDQASMHVRMGAETNLDAVPVADGKISAEIRSSDYRGMMTACHTTDVLVFGLIRKIYQAQLRFMSF